MNKPPMLHSLSYQDVKDGANRRATLRRGGRGKAVKSPVDAADENMVGGEEERRSKTVAKSKAREDEARITKSDFSEEVLGNESEIGLAKNEEVKDKGKGAVPAKVKKGKGTTKGVKKGGTAEGEEVGVGEPAAKPRKGVKGGGDSVSEEILFCDEEVSSLGDSEAAVKPREARSPVTKDAKTGEILKTGEIDLQGDDVGVAEEDHGSGKEEKVSKRGTKQNTSKPRAKRARK